MILVRGGSSLFFLDPRVVLFSKSCNFLLKRVVTVYEPGYRACFESYFIDGGLFVLPCKCVLRVLF